ncbi:MAG: hypothetical protein JNL98_03520 [Bryobacterales bacterium]|nr:hypothetical protein [Bryobacterales bacterium]
MFIEFDLWVARALCFEGLQVGRGLLASAKRAMQGTFLRFIQLGINDLALLGRVLIVSR